MSQAPWRAGVSAGWFQALVVVSGLAPLLWLGLWTEQEWIVHRWSGYGLTAIGVLGLVCTGALMRFRRTRWDLVAAGALVVAALLSLAGGQAACAFAQWAERPACW